MGRHDWGSPIRGGRLGAEDVDDHKEKMMNWGRWLSASAVAMALLALLLGRVGGGNEWWQYAVFVLCLAAMGYCFAAGRPQRGGTTIGKGTIDLRLTRRR